MRLEHTRVFLALLGVTIATGWIATPSPALAQAPAQHKHATGPLRVHPTNSRYFTDGSGKAVYLTGSHIWNNFQEIGVTNPPPEFDNGAYLDFLTRHGHNFIRLWRYEFIERRPWADKQSPLRFIAHHPWKRTGAGTAIDGLPKFDLTQWDDAFFERLRSRVQAAQERGIYVAIILFDGWCLRTQPTFWAGNIFNEANNINGISGDPNGDGRGLEVQMLQVDAITDLQKAYIRKVIDAVNDLDNVLYEISNESLYLPGGVQWQVEMTKYIKESQAKKPQQHPVGMTNLVAITAETRIASNDSLFASPANWVSPGMTTYGPGDLYSVNPPATTGKKIEILDSDHTFNNACNTRTSKERADHAWVWKSFLRGYNPIYMDPIDLSRPDGVMEYAKGNAYAVVLARPAMGHTRAYAERMNLAAMTPRDDLSSTKYCLANPGSEYLIYLPDGGEVTVDLSAAKAPMTVEWFNPRTAEKQTGEQVTGSGKSEFHTPFTGDAVLYLRGK